MVLDDTSLGCLALGMWLLLCAGIVGLLETARNWWQARQDNKHLANAVLRMAGKRPPQ